MGNNIKSANTTKKSSTPYDDVFRTLLNDCKQLLLPVLNELFGENYTGNEAIVYKKNEHFLNRQTGIQEERITDSAFTVIGEKSRSYLFECQSNPDSSMLVRIFEYETQIALDEGKVVGNVLEVSIPHSAILYLRSTRTTPNKLQIKINTPNGSVAYDVMVMKVKDYGIKDIFEKSLLFLIPFYIFNYGSQKQLEELEKNADNMASLENEYKAIVEHLNKLSEQEIISEYYHMVILEMSRKVLESLAARHEKVAKGVIDIMGGTVLNYKAKDIFREGELAKAKEMVLAMHNDGIDDKIIAKYARTSVETVKEWISLQKA